MNRDDTTQPGRSRLHLARERVATARTMLVAGSLVAFCGALLFARAEAPGATSSPATPATQATSSAALTAADTTAATSLDSGYAATYDDTYGDSSGGFSQGSLSTGSGAPQGRTGVS